MSAPPRRDWPTTLASHQTPSAAPARGYGHSSNHNSYRPQAEPTWPSVSPYCWRSTENQNDDGDGDDDGEEEDGEINSAAEDLAHLYDDFEDEEFSLAGDKKTPHEDIAETALQESQFERDDDPCLGPDSPQSPSPLESPESHERKQARHDSDFEDMFGEDEEACGDNSTIVDSSSTLERSRPQASMYSDNSQLQYNEDVLQTKNIKKSKVAGMNAGDDAPITHETRKDNANNGDDGDEGVWGGSSDNEEHNDNRHDAASSTLSPETSLLSTNDDIQYTSDNEDQSIPRGAKNDLVCQLKGEKRAILQGENTSIAENSKITTEANEKFCSKTSACSIPIENNEPEMHNIDKVASNVTAHFSSNGKTIICKDKKRYQEGGITNKAIEESKANKGADVSTDELVHMNDLAQAADSNATPCAPMTAAQALAAARRRASIPKVSRLKSKMATKTSSLTSKGLQVPGKTTGTTQQSSNRPLNCPNLTNQESSSLDSPKRTYYPTIHPDKFWSTMRGWDFVRELNDAMKNKFSPSKPKPQDKNDKGKKRRFEEVDYSEAENKTSKTKPPLDLPQTLPDAFDSIAQYKSLWVPLLINEAKAQILSEVVSIQSSPSTAWIQHAVLSTGVTVRWELSRSSKDLSTSSINNGISGGATLLNFTSLEPTVVLHLQPMVKGAGMGCPVSTNDLILFVRHATTIELALRGKAFDALDAAEIGSLGVRRLPKGRLGFIGHAINHRSRSIDGLLVRVSQKIWSQFAALDEAFALRIGSNITSLREFCALCRADGIPLTKYLLAGDTSASQSRKEETISGHVDSGSSLFDPLASSGGNTLPIGFRIFIKSKMNISQLHAITAAAREYGEGGFTLIKGPPGTGKSTTLVSVLNALHLRQYQEYYSAIESIVTATNVSTPFEELAALNKAAEVKPRILVCAPSNSAIDNVIVKIMNDRFVDGNGAKYSPSIVRVGTGIVNPAVKHVGLKEMVDAIIAQGTDVGKLQSIIANGRQDLKRIQKEIQKLKLRIQALVNACPYDICEDWEVRIDEGSFDSTGRILFVNHKTRTTTYDIPPKVRPTERSRPIKKMPHYVELLLSLTKYVERHNNESLNLEKYIILQNAASSIMEGGRTKSNEIAVTATLAQDLETHVLNTNHIILTTLGSAGSRSVESASKFEVVVIDEAAQSSEPATLVALQLGSSHAILVGDPQQLPATIFSVSGRSTKYDRSLFQRLEECGHPVHLLNTQYRMHPVISAFPRLIFYDGMLRDGSNVQQSDFGGNINSVIRRKFPYFQPFNILDLNSKEERDGTSLSNIHEARLVLHLFWTLDRETGGLLANSRVAVITPYSQQSSLLHRLFLDVYGATYLTRVEISTVDAFQGREAGIVIYSCVRAGSSGSGIGFLSDVQRMNVALTRAKYFLFIIARRRSIMVNPYWRKLIGYARERSSIIHVPIERPEKMPSEINKENDVLFPELANLVPVHQAAEPGIESDSEFSA